MTASSNWRLSPWLNMFRDMHPESPLAGAAAKPRVSVWAKGKTRSEAFLPSLVSHCISPLDLMRTIEFASRCKLPLNVYHEQPEPAQGFTDISIDIRKAHYDHLQLEAESAQAIVADLSAMRGIHIDAHAQIATAGVSASAREIAAAANRFRLSPAGGDRDPGSLANLVATGGFTPFLHGTYPAPGSLVSAQIVLPGCRILNTSAFENADIFRAICDGECDFGIVSSYQFRLESMHEHHAGLIFFSWSELERVVHGYMRATASAPPELSLTLGILVGPNGDRTVVLAPSWRGDQARGQQTLLHLQEIGTPLLVVSGDGSALATTAIHDTCFPGKRLYDRNVWKASEFSPEAILKLVGDRAALPSFSTVLFHHNASAPDERSAVEIIFPAGNSARPQEWMKQVRHKLSRFPQSYSIGQQGVVGLRKIYDPNGELSRLPN